MAAYAACGMHPPAGWSRRFSADSLRGRWTGPSREGSARAHFCKHAQLRVGPALTPQSMRGAVAFGGRVSVGVGVCDEVMGTSGSGGPGGVVVVLCRGGSSGAGAQAYADPWVHGHGFRLGLGLGSARAAVEGHLLNVGRHRVLVGWKGRCWIALALLWSGQEWSVGLGCRFSVVVG